ncbi:ATP-binding protein [Streptomyces antibioticus]|uniref:ATP-binding protein n=1 Tax=Streptomyces antibioticus TaxID=1890 RepID=UPI003D709CED
MTTTAVQPTHALHTHDKVVMSERFQVEPLCGAGAPRDDDAARVGAMRRIAAIRLRRCGLDDLIDEAMLVVSELLTNALLHSGTNEVFLDMAVRKGFLVITVIDGMPGVAKLKRASGDAESGRGLELVAAVAEENGGTWGTRDAGAETWCRLELPSAEGQS